MWSLCIPLVLMVLAVSEDSQGQVSDRSQLLKVVVKALFATRVVTAAKLRI